MQSTTPIDPARTATTAGTTTATQIQPAAKKSCSCCASSASNGAAGAGTADAGPESAAAEHAAAACDVVGGAQEARITVKGGYAPSTVRLTQGVPARLVFDRQEASRCSEELLIPAFGVRQALPQGRETVIEFTPERAGTFPFTCGMEMLRGELVVAEA